MIQVYRKPASRSSITVEDWQLIISAISAYSHNTRYRDLMERLQSVAAINGSVSDGGVSHKPLERLAR